MTEILLYCIAPLVGLLPLEKLPGRKTALISSIILLVFSAILIFPILLTEYSYTSKTANLVVKLLALASAGIFLGQVAPLNDKRSYVGVIVVFALIFSSLFVTTRSLDAIFNEKSSSLNQWSIGNYMVYSHREIGIAGPAITKYTLYEFKLNYQLIRELSSTVENDDSICIITFQRMSTKGNYYFDKCKVTIDQ